jgi:hypothetical protein
MAYLNKKSMFYLMEHVLFPYDKYMNVYMQQRGCSKKSMAECAKAVLISLKWHLERGKRQALNSWLCN